MTGRPAARAYVALLRGVNVGGRNGVSMPLLKRTFEQLGLQDVRTYINSGNVLFSASTASPPALERNIDRILARELRLPARTVVRSETEMDRLVATINQTLEPDPQWKDNVIFLRRHLNPKRVLTEFVLKSDIERVVTCPGTLLWSARTSALGRTAMMKFGRSRFYEDATVRSVATTRKIWQLMQAL